MAIRRNIYIWKTKFSSLKQYLLDLLFCINAKKVHIDQVITQTFLLCLKRTSHKLLKVATEKKSLPSLYIIDTTCFDECFSFYVMAEGHYFLYQFIVIYWFGATAALFGASVLKEVHILYPLSLQ